EDQHEELFQVFKRLEVSKNYPGLGIGLSHVKRIVQRHEGYISASSVPGETTFTFCLPTEARGLATKA
ncbi:MAG: ATP-binding protein, partial [Bacteroidota bacterium]